MLQQECFGNDVDLTDQVSGKQAGKVGIITTGSESFLFFSLFRVSITHHNFLSLSLTHFLSHQHAHTPSVFLSVLSSHPHISSLSLSLTHTSHPSISHHLHLIHFFKTHTQSLTPTTPSHFFSLAKTHTHSTLALLPSSSHSLPQRHPLTHFFSYACTHSGQNFYKWSIFLEKNILVVTSEL